MTENVQIIEFRDSKLMCYHLRLKVVSGSVPCSTTKYKSPNLFRAFHLGWLWLPSSRVAGLESGFFNKAGGHLGRSPMRVIRSPDALETVPAERTVFLAGSIDMGGAEDWQSALAVALVEPEGVLFNPRRENWESNWPADVVSPPFAQQVKWELDAMEAADLIVFYFAPTSQAPISLLELGLAARTGKALVCCPPGYWRKGNVDMVCAYYGIPSVDSLAQLAQGIRNFCAGGSPG